MRCSELPTRCPTPANPRHTAARRPPAHAWMLFHANRGPAKSRVASVVVYLCIHIFVTLQVTCGVCKNLAFLHEGECHTSCDAFPGYYGRGTGR